MLAWSFFGGCMLMICWKMGYYISIVLFTFCPMNRMGKKEFEQKTSLVTVLCLRCNAWERMKFEFLSHNFLLSVFKTNYDIFE